MEEDDISLLHDKINHFSLEILELLDTEVGLVDFSIIRVRVVIKLTQMSLGTYV